ncbi:MAG: hypothetical protein JWQ72_3242, partial [Polaromonas sp.]|nr:hypothetical protein [Polaromonas sp.]
ALRQIAAAGKVAGTLATGDIGELRAAGARLLMTRTNELLAQGAADFQVRLARPRRPH